MKALEFDKIGIGRSLKQYMVHTFSYVWK